MNHGEKLGKSRVEMHYSKDVPGCDHLLKGGLLPPFEVAQPLSKEWVSPPQNEVIIPLLKDMGPNF